MLATVSARVPVEVRDQVHKKLRNSGRTPSQFINDVYVKYLNDDTFFDTSTKNKTRSVDNIAIIETIKASTCNYGNPLPAMFDFKEELKQRRKADYEAMCVESPTASNVESSEPSSNERDRRSERGE